FASSPFDEFACAQVLGAQVAPRPATPASVLYAARMCQRSGWDLSDLNASHGRDCVHSSQCCRHAPTQCAPRPKEVFGRGGGATLHGNRSSARSITGHPTGRLDDDGPPPRAVACVTLRRTDEPELCQKSLIYSVSVISSRSKRLALRAFLQLSRQGGRLIRASLDRRLGRGVLRRGGRRFPHDDQVRRGFELRGRNLRLKAAHSSGGLTRANDERSGDRRTQREQQSRAYCK